MQCGLAYDVMRRECHHYHRNLYPKGSVLTSFLKHHGVEVEPWYDISDASTYRPTTPIPLPSSSSTYVLVARLATVRLLQPAARLLPVLVVHE